MKYIMSDERTQLLINAGLTPNDFCPMCWSKVKRILNQAKDGRKKFEYQNLKLRQSIENAMEWLETMPCGAIGENGATQKELNEAAKKGEYFWDDEGYDITQNAWLILHRALAEMEARDDA